MSNISFQVTTPDALREHNDRIRSLERSGGPWIFVGTIGLDGVDDVLTPDSPAFKNSWTNSLGEDPPVSFTVVNGWVHIRGGFVGGANGTVVFTLPPGYRPSHRQRFVCGTASPAHYATYYVETSGDVVFGQVV